MIVREPLIYCFIVDVIFMCETIEFGDNLML